MAAAENEETPGGHFEFRAKTQHKPRRRAIAAPFLSFFPRRQGAARCRPARPETQNAHLFCHFPHLSGPESGFSSTEFLRTSCTKRPIK